MWIFRPVPHGHRYGLAIELAAALFLIWLFGRVPADRIFRTGALAVILAIGLAWGVRSFTTIDPQAEIVGVYQSVFEALDSGRNPYTCGTIYHRDENGAVVYGNFNYPPAEIGPYYLAYRLLGRWDSAVLTAVMLALNALGCLLLLATFPALPAAKLAAFFPIFLFGEIKTNPSMTFLVTAALLCLMVRDQRAPRPGRRLLIAAVFGVGLLTKFLIMPLMAAYYWRRFDRKRPASLGPLAAGGAIALAVSALLMAPFGIGAVLRNTLLFNAVLKDREALTTFYPNVLSGPLAALGLGMIYPFLAVAAMGVAVLVAPRLRLLPALLTACFVFLLAAPTPEPQYLPIIVYAALAWRCLDITERTPAGPAAAEIGRG
ncbi:MAG TPA: hypothetical protein P5119_05625 [Candidatus Aminicenantes bacterium]|nr:hypothetical protein [Candidatus Aminicenantes bacterium]HRY64803.1 hypothetical protein [Candidatus Aminicenantes bacterium]HRZ71716.1 hypothetical protein [Candidatus Aminicenantes bacterium]